MRVLGLDLGSASIGWALVDFINKEKNVEMLGAGSRSIPHASPDTVSKFNSGKSKTPCGERTKARGMRRNLDRWQLHREQLTEALVRHGFMGSNEVFPPLNPLEVWKLRADAATDTRLSLAELSRVLLHINHRRGYRHAKSDMGGGKETDYVARINNLHKELISLNLTPGQYFYTRLLESATQSASGRISYSYRIREKVLPRRAYSDETRQILLAQQRHYPDQLTDEVVEELHRLIFYQRPLKSCKHLVSRCEFESRTIVDAASGKERVVGPRVAPVSSPLAQVCRLWEAINNITLTNPRRDPEDDIIATTDAEAEKLRKYRHTYILTLEERQRIFEYMNANEKLTTAALLKLLNLKKKDGFTGDKLLAKGITGNSTAVAIAAALCDLPAERRAQLLRFNLTIGERVDETTGEVRPYITTSYREEPLFQLWHTLYSIDDRDELFAVLSRKFNITHEDTLHRLFALDFTKAGYAAKSARFMCRIIPYLMQGLHYSEACEAVGVNHSGSLTAAQNAERPLVDTLPPIPNGSMRQPVVEKILNQTINLVNALKARYGYIDEIRVEMARELKQSSQERAKADSAIKAQENKNKLYAAEVKGMGITPTRRRVRKMRMLKEEGMLCMYCGKKVEHEQQFLVANDFEIDHILPQSRYFDDSFANTVCACRKCNKDKGNRTGYEFMKTKSEEKFNAYKERVIGMGNSGAISKKKMQYLLTDGDAIPESFINRDLNETQYIARKAMELLRAGFRTVSASSGAVTDFFRHAWGYDTILHDLNLPKYVAAGLAETVDYESHSQHHTALRIKDWDKRCDHRHHAVDALVVALTRPAHIQRLNTLNAQSDSASSADTGGNSRKRLEQWAAAQPHVPIAAVKEVVEEISVSFKGGKKLTTPGKRITDRHGNTVRTLVPRGPLHNEFYHGAILVPNGPQELAKALETPQLICDPQLRAQLTALLNANHGNVDATLKQLKKQPILLHGEEIKEVPCFRRKIVRRYALKSTKIADIEKVVDPAIRALLEERASLCKNDTEFQRSLTEAPIFLKSSPTHHIKTVRRFTPMSPKSLAPVSRNAEGHPIGFCQTQSNHHLAFYRLPDGKIVERVSSVWECVKRKRYGIPTVVNNPAEAWDTLWNLPDNDDISEIAAGLPPRESQFVMSLQLNEMVVLGMTDDEWHDALTTRNLKEINRHLYRVWQLASKDYCFKFHTNTKAKIIGGDKETKAHYRLASIKALFALHPRKIRTSLLGELLIDDLNP